MAFEAWSQTRRTPGVERPGDGFDRGKGRLGRLGDSRALFGPSPSLARPVGRDYGRQARFRRPSPPLARRIHWTSTANPAAATRGALAPFAALVAGAVAMGVSPIFVRLADVGPFASAFWRVALALPLLYAWMRLADGRERARRAASRKRRSCPASPSRAISSSGTSRSSTRASPTRPSSPPPRRSGSCCSAGFCFASG